MLNKKWIDKKVQLINGHPYIGETGVVKSIGKTIEGREYFLVALDNKPYHILTCCVFHSYQLRKMK